MYYQS